MDSTVVPPASSSPPLDPAGLADALKYLPPAELTHPITPDEGRVRAWIAAQPWQAVQQEPRLRHYVRQMRTALLGMLRQELKRGWGPVPSFYLEQWRAHLPVGWMGDAASSRALPPWFVLVHGARRPRPANIDRNGPMRFKDPRGALANTSHHIHWAAALAQLPPAERATVPEDLWVASDWILGLGESWTRVCKEREAIPPEATWEDLALPAPVRTVLNGRYGPALFAHLEKHLDLMVLPIERWRQEVAQARLEERLPPSAPAAPRPRF